MRALLLSPGRSRAVPLLSETGPLCIAPLLGKCLAEYWIEHLTSLGAKEIVVIASDRPAQVRAHLGDGTRWGLRVTVRAEKNELTLEEARAKYCTRFATTPQIVIAMDHLPGQPARLLFKSYANWFAGIQAWIPQAQAEERIGVCEVQPGVWIGQHCRIDPSVEFVAPCWLGNNVTVQAGAILGPSAIIEDGALVSTGARVVQSVIGPSTFVGDHALVGRSLAQSSTLINWATNSTLLVPDAIWLSSLDEGLNRRWPSTWYGRVMAAYLLLLTSPVALWAFFRSIIRVESTLKIRQGLRLRAPGAFIRPLTFNYTELRHASGFLKRWPQLWSIVRGDMGWIGNRPLTPREYATLAPGFEQLWLARPPGLISLADAAGCSPGLGPEACAHASYYAVKAGPEMHRQILSDVLRHALNPAIRPQPATQSRLSSLFGLLLKSRSTHLQPD
jgi:hypothetical protein